jgi:membrane protein implicated in regulation of membrane protease activity
MDMFWWHWVVLGLVLSALELASAGGFFIIFFGAGAIVVGLLSLLNLAGPLWVQWLLFSALSVVSLRLFRDPLLRRMQANVPHARVDDLTKDVAIALEDIAPGAVGRVELRGSAWSARNVGPGPIAKVQRCTVRRVDGLMLHISAEGV